MALETYQKKRDFKHTTEPKGKVSKSSKHRFVVHEHHASHLHYDLRLEMGGVLKSWAVPKGPSLNPRQKRLAVMVEDHPVDYIDFEGHIPEGSYGAGDVVVWDTGDYELPANEDPIKKIDGGKLSFHLYGEKLKGEFHLVQIKGKGKQWLLIKGRDAFARADGDIEPILGAASPKAAAKPSRRVATRRAARTRRAGGVKGRELSAPSEATEPADVYLTPERTLPTVPGAQPAAMPDVVEPMLATLVDEPFSKPEWLYESKWDGVRAICFIKEGRARFVSRNGKEIGFRYPELAGLPERIHAGQAILDGEIVALDEKGQPSFQLLQSRVGLKNEKEIKRLASEHSVVYYVFDLLYYNGFDLRPAALLHRKALLEEIIEPNRVLNYSKHTTGNGNEAYERAKREGLEGIVAKHQASPYVQGRSNNWLKIKTVLRQEVVIGGYTQPRGTRELFGALVVGLYRRNGKLYYVGHVGGGFNHETLQQVYQAMQPLKIDRSPFAQKPETNEPVQWIKPALVCEVKFSQWTADEHLRQPIFVGLRDDKEPVECTFERRRDVRLEVEKVEQKVSLKEKKETGHIVEAAKLFKGDRLSGDTKVKVDTDTVSLTNLNKVYWPEEGYTKGDLIKYYYDIAEYILPYLKERPLILKRFPNGIHEQFFYQHDVDDAPTFVRRAPIEAEDGRVIDYAVCDNRATLLYLANLGAIAQHPWHSRVGDLDHPDWVVFDLDPQKAEFPVICDVALALKALLENLGLESYAKTSGSRGIHLYIPIQPIYSYEQVARFAERVATRLVREHTDIATLERSIKKRKGGHVYIDHLQNARGKSLVAPYSVRERAGATVAAPLDWKEVKSGLTPQAFTIKTMSERLKKKGDLFKSLLRKRQRLDEAMKRVEEKRPKRRAK